MKVLVLVEHLYLGGIERLLEQMARHIDLEKSEMIFYAFMTSDLKGIGEQIKQHGCKVYYEHKKNGYDFGLVRRLKRIIKQDQIDVIHTHDFGPMEYAIALKVLMPRLKLVHTQHTLHGIVKRRDYLFFFQLASWFYDSIHMVSPVVFNEMMARCPLLSKKRCRVTYNGIRIGDSQRLSPCFGEPLRILSVCRLSPEKNLPLTLQALSDLKKKGVKFQFVQCGAGDEVYTKNIYAMLRRLDLTDCVELKGFQDDVSSDLRWADIFISSSLTEGHPLAVIEAMEQGLICFLSDIPAHHFVNDDIAYFFPPSPSALSELIKLTCLDCPPKDLLIRRNKGIDLARSRFSIFRMIDQYIDSYQF